MATILDGNALSDTHHIAAHDDGQLLMRALIIDIELDIRKIHDMKMDWSRIPRYQLR